MKKTYFPVLFFSLSAIIIAKEKCAVSICADSFKKNSPGTSKKLLKFVHNVATLLFLFFITLYSYAQVLNDCPKTGLACIGGTHKGNLYNNILDGSGFLGQIYNNTACGLNYVQGSVLIERRSIVQGFNTNGTGLPSLSTIAGLPPCYVLDKAYLWFTASYTEASPPVTTVSITDPSNAMNVYNPALAGQSGPKCWGEIGTATYRADVTTSISGNGAYSFNINGFSNGSNEIDGATLMIIYTNPGAGYQGSLIIWDGAATSGNSNGYPATEGGTISGFSACDNSSYANAFLIVSDMQSNVNGGVHNDVLNGSSMTFANNFYNFDVINTSVFAGQNTSTFSANGQSQDCFEVAVIGLYSQTTTCVTCATGSTLTLNTTSNAALCSACNGSASVTATGGTGIYSYQWSPSGQTTQSVSGLCAGNYSVAVFDNGGCNSASITITKPPDFVLSSSSTKTGCGPPIGTASVMVTSGTPPYTYLWNNGQTTTTATALYPGTYTVTVTDKNNCTTTDSVSVGSLSNITASSSSTPAGCTIPSGTATVNVLGGTAPYTYLWNNGQTTSTATGLYTGAYSVTVTDSQSCVATTSGIVGVNSSGPTLFVPQANVTCPGGSDGIASVTAIGTSPFTYLWSNGGVSANDKLLSAGTYTVTVTDGGGCTSTQSVTILQPPAFVLTPSTSATGCNTTTGAASISVSGATSPYTYSWSNGQTSLSITGVGAGTYTVTVTDSKNCTAIASVTVSTSNGATLTISQVNVSCHGASDGSATVSVTGGSSPFTYLWSNGNTTTQASNLQSQTYTVTVTDANGCSATATAAITEPPSITFNFPRLYYTCEATSATLTASGGTSYSWAPSSGLSCTACPNPVADPPVATTYTVTIINGPCSDTALVMVIPAPTPPPPVITVVGGDTLVSSHEATYQWYLNGTPIAGATDSFYVFTLAGTYAVRITDSTGCGLLSGGVLITSTNELSDVSQIVVYPNPTGNRFTVYVPNIGGATVGLKIELYNVLGEKVYQYKLDGDKIQINLKDKAPGLYLYRILTEKGTVIYNGKLIVQ